MKRKILLAISMVGALLVTRCSLPTVLAKSPSEVVKILNDTKPKQICFESRERAIASSRTIVYDSFNRNYQTIYLPPSYDSWLPEASNDRILFLNTNQARPELIYLKRGTLNIKFGDEDVMSKCLRLDETFSVEHTEDMIYVEINKS